MEVTMELWLALVIMWCLGGVANYLINGKSIVTSGMPFWAKYILTPVIMLIGGWAYFLLTVRIAWYVM